MVRIITSHGIATIVTPLILCMALFGNRAIAAPTPEHPTSTISKGPSLVNRAVTAWTSVSRAEVSGECWWDWNDRDEITRAHCAVDDTKGNSHSVFVRMILYSFTNQLQPITSNFARFTNTEGAAAPKQYDLEFHRFRHPHDGGIQSVQVQACDDAPGPFNGCATSGPIYNPLR